MRLQQAFYEESCREPEKDNVSNRSEAQLHRSSLGSLSGRVGIRR